MIYKHSLPNGLTVILYPRQTISKISVQMWYGVGSKHEKSGQKGLAHLLEHMTFKGTKKLAELDIGAITGKLAAYCNAFTSQDYTAYVYDVASSDWKVILDLLADTMTNCTFKPDLLNSELGAVMQELKMYKDDYDSMLEEELTAVIFSGHPYHYPIIGFKQDLLAVTQQSLLDFYHEHYVPNNATLVVVGDFDQHNVLEYITQSFGHIPGGSVSVLPPAPKPQDFKSMSVTLYRDIQQPFTLLAFVVPGLCARQNYYLDLMTWILGKGRGSRLYKKLVEELSLVTELDVYWRDMFDYGLFCIRYCPKNSDDNDATIKIINDELRLLSEDLVSENELERATNQVLMEFNSLFEDQQNLADEIGKHYLATASEHALQEYVVRDNVLCVQAIQHLFRTYFSAQSMHTAFLSPMPNEQEKEHWLALQEQADRADEFALSERERVSGLEELSYAHQVHANKLSSFAFPQHKNVVLSNGPKIVYYHMPTTPTIKVIIEFATKSHYDEQDLVGLNNMAMQTIIMSSTKNYSATDLAQQFEQYGMSIEAAPGVISLSLLKKDLRHALTLLQEILFASELDEKTVKTVRDQTIAALQGYWDDPSQYIMQLARQAVYKEHPYAKPPLGTLESVARIGRSHVVDFYQKNITPMGTFVALVGDLDGYDIPNMLQEALGAWQGPDVQVPAYPTLHQTNGAYNVQQAPRDQVAVCFAGLSITRMDKDYDALAILDHIITGGSQGSMSSRLFTLREQTGLFYSIGGSLLGGAGKQPGMMYIQTIVSPENLDEVIASIKDILENAVTISAQELQQTQRALMYSCMEAFESHYDAAELFLFLERYNLPVDYISSWMESVNKVTQQQVQEVARKLLLAANLDIILVGRVDSVD